MGAFASWAQSVCERTRARAPTQIYMYTCARAWAGEKEKKEIKLSNKQTTMIWKLYGIELKMIWKRKKTEMCTSWERESRSLGKRERARGEKEEKRLMASHLRRQTHIAKHENSWSHIRLLATAFYHITARRTKHVTMWNKPIKSME